MVRGIAPQVVRRLQARPRQGRSMIPWKCLVRSPLLMVAIHASWEYPQHLKYVSTNLSRKGRLILGLSLFLELFDCGF